MSYRQNYLDLDPTYLDPFDRPMLRLTFDFEPNEIKLAQYHATMCARIAETMGAERVQPGTSSFPYSITSYQTTHNLGGAVLGTDPTNSAVNTYLQAWDVPNVFVVGSSAFPHTPAQPPTATIGALAFRTAHAIKTQYLKRRGPLLHV